MAIGGFFMTNNCCFHFHNYLAYIVSNLKFM